MKAFCANFYNSDKDIADYPIVWKQGNKGPDSLKMSASLMIDGVIEEGFSIIGTANKKTPNSNVVFVLSYTDPVGGVKGVPIARAEWLPRSGHNNLNWADNPNDRLIPAWESHLHCFNENARLPDDTWKDQGLPLAYPISESLTNYEDFLEFVAKKFRILNMSNVPQPPWETECQPDLL